MLNFQTISVRDIGVPARTVQTAPSGRHAVPIAEVAGASVSFSFEAVREFRRIYGAAWLATIFTALDATDPEVIETCLGVGLHGTGVYALLEALPIDRAAELIAAGLLVRLKG